MTLSPTDMTYIVYTRPHNSLMHIIHLMSPSRKPPEWFLSSLTSVLTATLCPSSFHWGCAYHLVIGQKRLHVSPRQAFFFFSWSEIQILDHLSFSRIKLWVAEGVLSRHRQFPWLGEYEVRECVSWPEGCESWGAFHTNNCARVDC